MFLFSHIGGNLKCFLHSFLHMKSFCLWGAKKELKRSSGHPPQFRIPGENDLYLTLRASVL